MARLHPAQRKIAQSPTRFKVLRCGRRFGKTTYAVEEMTGACLFEPGPVAYFATTRDQARDIVWAELLEKVIGTSNYVSHNEQRLEVTRRRPDGTSNRIRLSGWENIETARGKKYSLVVLDELDRAPAGRSDTAAAATRRRSCPTTGDHGSPLASRMCHVLEPRRVVASRSSGGRPVGRASATTFWVRRAATGAGRLAAAGSTR